MKKLVCLVLSAILLLSCMSVPALADDKITLTVLAQNHPESTATVENQWWWKWVEHWFQQQGYNVEMDVTIAKDVERLNLMLNTNNLPDILWGWDLGASGITTYGVNNGQLLNMLPYMNEEFMPNWTAYAASEPMMTLAVAEHTAPNGELYTLPYVTGTNVSYNQFYGHQRMYWNKEWLDQLNLEVPTTLEGVVDTLRAFKANIVHPDGLEIFPATSTQIFLEAYLTGAFGWQQTHRFGQVITIKNGEVVLPALDPDYKEYLQLMKTLYDEGLIPTDFWTATEDTQRARIANGQVGFMGDWTLNTADEAHFSRWVGAGPVTSKYTDNMVTVNSPGYTMGWTFISSETKYPELCAKLVDYMYSAEGMLMYVHGVQNAEDDPFGMLSGWIIDETTGKITYNDVENGTCPDNANYSYSHIGRFIYVSSAQQPVSDYISTLWNADRMATYLGEFTDAITGFTRPLYFSLSRKSDNSDGYWRITHYQAWKDGTTFTYLPVTFLDEETNDEIADCTSGLYTYVTNEAMNFITGKRSFDEFDQFVEGLKGIGADRYVEIMTEVYADYINQVYGEKE